MNDFQLTRTESVRLLGEKEAAVLAKEVSNLPSGSMIAVRCEEYREDEYMARVETAQTDYNNPAYTWTYVSREEWLMS